MSNNDILNLIREEVLKLKIKNPKLKFHTEAYRVILFKVKNKLKICEEEGIIKIIEVLLESKDKELLSKFALRTKLGVWKFKNLKPGKQMVFGEEKILKERFKPQFTLNTFLKGLIKEI